MLAHHRGESAVLRISNVYGPGQPAAPGQGVIAHWLHALVRGEAIEVFGSFDVARDYVYVSDVCEAVAAAVARLGALPPVLNIGSSTPTTLGQLINLVQDITGVPCVREVQLGARSFDADSTWLDCTQARIALGWRPTMGLREGIAATWDHLGRTAESVPARMPPSGGVRPL